MTDVNEYFLSSVTTPCTLFKPDLLCGLVNIKKTGSDCGVSWGNA